MGLRGGDDAEQARNEDGTIRHGDTPFRPELGPRSAGSFEDGNRKRGASDAEPPVRRKHASSCGF
jgi:hypothetical protein